MKPWANLLLLGVSVTGSMSTVLGAEPAVEKLTAENADLRKRLEALESVLQKEGLIATEKTPASNPVKAMSNITISGFAQASYFYNTANPLDKTSDGYLWTTGHNNFSLNKIKLTLASPVPERSGDTWGAGFRTSLMLGQDSTVLNTGSPRPGFEMIREAFVQVNAPIGTGLDIKAGQLISLLNWESGDGGAVNPNFSQGYQWFYTGNGPAAGVQLSYVLTDWLEVRTRVQNGMYAGPVDNNGAKTLLGSLNFKPSQDLWVNLIGFGGDESDTLTVKGASMLAGYNITSAWHTGFELDYFNFAPKTGSSADLYSIGGRTWYDLTPTVSIALRGEYLDDPDGGGLKNITLPGRPGSAITSLDPDGNLASVTATLTWSPVPSLRVQPEVRYDHTSYTGGLDGKKDRIIVGAGVSYLF